MNINMNKNQPKNHHLTIRINETQYKRLMNHLKKESEETLSNVIRKSLHRYLDDENNKPKIN